MNSNVSSTPLDPPRVALLACRVLESEILLLAKEAPHILETRFFEVGLHDRPDQLRAALQTALEELGNRTDLDAIIFAYGLCGLGTAGLRPVRHKLVIPRAHDCITIFMGSKEAYAEHQRRCTTCYYYTPGWNRERRVPGPERLEAIKADLAQRFDEEEVEFLLETERETWAVRDQATFIDLGTPESEKEAQYARGCAEWLGWKFEHLKGDPQLLRDLLWGNWDDARFQVVEPGMQLGHSPDDAILRSEPAKGSCL